MKRFIILLSIIISTSAFAQHNFSITSEQKIIWQKVYDSPVTINEFHTWLFNNGQHNDIAIADNTITCWLNELPIASNQNKYSTMQMSILARDSNAKCFATIQFKEGRYRVTLEQIQFIQAFDSSLSEKGEITYIEGPAINRKGTFNKMVEGNTLVILDALFSNIYEYKLSAHLNDEW